MKWLNKIFFIAAILSSVFFFGKYGSENSIFYGDALGYYSYLPSYFCLNNLDSITKIPANKGVEDGIINHFRQQENENTISPKGYYINQYTMGVAIFELPFFLAAHTYSKINNLKTNGYTWPYHNALIVCNFFYILMGLWISYKVLIRVFSKDISVITISLLLLATNLFWFTNMQFAMVHPIIFCLVAVLILLTIKLYETPKWNYFISIALILGSIALLRPTDIIVGLIPLLYGIKNRKEITERLGFLRKHIKQIIVSAILFFLPLLPQLLFWKKYSGKFIYYSYTKQGFDFLHPRIFDGLLGPDNGWLLYSPVWILALVGLFSKKVSNYRWILLTLVPLYIYVIYSWWCFQYINGFGSRPMIHLYPLLILPLAGAIDIVSNYKRMIIVLSMLLGFFAYHNLHYTYLEQRGKYWAESSTYQFYISSMFKSNLSYNDLVAMNCSLIQPRAPKIEFIKELSFVNYNIDTADYIVYDATLKDSIIEIKGVEYPEFALEYEHNEAVPRGAYLKASCAVKFPHFIGNPYAYVNLIHSFYEGDQHLTWRGINTFMFMGLPNDRDLRLDSIYVYQGMTNQWDTLDFFIPYPPEMANKRSKLYLWNNAHTDFYIQYLKLELYKQK